MILADDTDKGSASLSTDDMIEICKQNNIIVFTTSFKDKVVKFSESCSSNMYRIANELMQECGDNGTDSILTFKSGLNGGNALVQSMVVVNALGQSETEMTVSVYMAFLDVYGVKHGYLKMELWDYIDKLYKENDLIRCDLSMTIICRNTWFGIFSDAERKFFTYLFDRDKVREAKEYFYSAVYKKDDNGKNN